MQRQHMKRECADKPKNKQPSHINYKRSRGRWDAPGMGRASPTNGDEEAAWSAGLGKVLEETIRDKKTYKKWSTGQRIFFTKTK